MKYLMALVITCTIAFLAAPAGLRAQDNGPFDIYIFSDFYSKSVRDYLLQNNCAPAHLLGQGVIDPDKDLKINVESIKKYTAGFYPDANATGLYVIDWEARLFDDLRKYDKSDSRFKAAEAAYIQLVSVIKEFRPRLTVGIYGLPFRFFSDAQRKGSGTDKLDGLLSKCDALTPSLYIYYTDEEIGSQRNTDYLKKNMDLALSYGARLNKPVIPFFWYKVHPGNKKFGMKVMSKDKMEGYMSLLSTYRYQGKKLNGIIWWEGGEKIDRPGSGGAAGRQARAAAAPAANTGGERSRDSIIMNYTAPFIKKKKQ